MPLRIRSVIASVVLGVAVIPLAATSADAHPSSWFKNCTAFNHHWPHGVGRSGAHDHSSGTPVTNFKRSTSLYNHAMSVNGGLDRDKDHVACEKS